MRNIAIITGSRGEYGYIRPVIRAIEQTSGLNYGIIATNLHLLSDFGHSIDEMDRDGFVVSDRLFMAMDGYTPASMSKSLGVFLMSVTDSLARIKPDIVLLAGDRGEQLMAAVAATHMNMVVAHIQAGELSGNIDGMTRHAIARYTHMHFASSADAAERLRRSGEEEFRIYLTGAPQLDELVNGEFASADEVAKACDLKTDRPTVLCVQHPVTEEFEQTTAQVTATLEALADLQCQTVIVFPNNDAGSEEVRRAIERFRGANMRLERSMPRRMYLGLMRMASAMVGNSSSGLIEAPCFGLPAVNIGNRQRGRERGNNVIDVAADREAIKAGLAKAMSPEFRKFLRDEGTNPYRGDGQVGKRIAELLGSVAITEELLKKQMAY